MISEEFEVKWLNLRMPFCFEKLPHRDKTLLVLSKKFIIALLVPVFRVCLGNHLDLHFWKGLSGDWNDVVDLHIGRNEVINRNYRLVFVADVFIQD